jgi:hypothetical protein
MLRYILLDTMLFNRDDDPVQSRTDLTWVLEALTQLDQNFLRAHPETPLLYNAGVVYERPGQFNGECEEVTLLKKALGSKASDSKVADALNTVQMVLGGERFRDVGRIIEKGKVDCDNLACWRAAELRQNGIKASPYITWKQRLDGGVTYHVLVRWPDGTTEDPSLLLGMGGENRREDRDKEIAKNAERVRMLQSAASRPRNFPSTDGWE